MDSRRELLAALPRGGLAVEVGSWRGDFAAEILSIVQPVRLILIDTWQDYWHHIGQTVFDEVQRRFRDDQRVEFWRGLSHDLIPQLPERGVSIAYVDADHIFEHVLSDLEDLLPKMQPGGWLCGHDYCCVDEYGVVRAVAVFCARHELSLDLLTDEPLQPVLGSPRQHYEPAVSYNSYGIHIP